MENLKNFVAKGEIACFEQLLLLSQYFQKSSAVEASESVYILESVKTQHKVQTLNINNNIIAFVDMSLSMGKRYKLAFRNRVCSDQPVHILSIFKLHTCFKQMKIVFSVHPISCSYGRI